MASGELRAWNPGWIDWAQDKFAGLYGDYRTGMKDARKLTDLFNYAPVAGEAIDLAGFNDALREGRMMDAGIYGAAAAIPGIPGKQLVKIKDIFRQDNPGVSRGAWDWIKEKQSLADQDYTTFRGVRGATTGWLDSTVDLPVDMVKKLKGARGEVRVPGDPQYDHLKDIVDREGWNPKSPILISVNHRGEPFITEGNTRTAVAAAKGIKTIPAEVQWLNGAEEVVGPLTPDILQQWVDLAGKR